MVISIKDTVLTRHRDCTKRQLLSSVATIVKEERQAPSVFDSVDVPSTSDDNDEVVVFEGDISGHINAEVI